MGIIKLEDIAGVRLQDGTLLCQECMDSETEYEEGQYILVDEIEQSDDLYFCDQCKKQL